jgi:phosphoglycolate phosphatase
LNAVTSAAAARPAREAVFDAAIVDLDGTMVDTLGDFVVALQRMLDGLPAPYSHHTVTRSEVERLVGKGSENLVKSLLALVNPEGGAMENVAIFARALAAYQQHYAAINGQQAHTYPGVVQGLRQLQARGLRLACVTNKPTAFALALLREKALDGFFELTLGGDAVARKKPDPLPLHMACAALGVAPARTLMVGDSSNDAQAARAAGCPVLLVTYGYNHGEPIRQVDADAYTDSLAHLPEALWRRA